MQWVIFNFPKKGKLNVLDALKKKKRKNKAAMRTGKIRRVI